LKVLVTGGAGYIGSVVTKQLLVAGHSAVVYDNLIRGKRAAVPRAAEFIAGDISDREAVTCVLKKHQPDAVMHLAALAEVAESMRLPELYFRNNVSGSLNLLECLLKAGIKRIVFSSTAAVYGIPERTPIEEDDALHPTNIYGESKLMTEHMLEWLNRIHGLRYATLRYFNAAGAAGDLGEDHQPESHLIPAVLQVALGKRECAHIFGNDYPTLDGTCVRDYIHILDLAQAHLLALAALEQRDRLIYNLGSGHGFSVREVVETARCVTGQPIPATHCPRRPGDPAVLVASSARIQRELGWKPQYADLESIIRTAWEWHREHPNGYQE
jgi:UDP-glucose 4-epimerase